MTIKVVALMGKSGAGKDTVLNAIMRLGDTEKYHKIVSCTTRPPREGEVEGDDYYFISEEKFTLEMYKGNFIEATDFNNWFYGALVSSLNPDKINLGIFTPTGVEALLETASSYDLDVLPIMINCADKTRIQRALDREEFPNVEEICRRFGADEADFAQIDFDYYSMNNEACTMRGSDFVKIISRHCEDFFG
jgi:guanylate kinase